MDFHKRFILFAVTLFLSACTNNNIISSPQVIILDGEKVSALTTDERDPIRLLALADIDLGPNDRLYFNGIQIPPGQALDTSVSTTLQVRRAMTVTLVTPESQKTLQSSAPTVGDALTETGLQLYASDLIDPPVSTPLSENLVITYRPAREIIIRAGDAQITVRSSARTVGQALAEGGIPLVGLDISQPGENEPIPADGQIKIIRVREAIELAQKSLPFTSEFQASADLELDQQAMLQAGAPGLSIARTRVRYEDGQEVARTTEAESVVRPPQNQVLGYGTKVVVRTAAVDGVTIEYWRAVQMYATSYSPCRLGVAGLCSYRTAAGLTLQKGVAATIRSFYNAMRGQPLYIPGYGGAVIGDLGGGFPDGRLWIDLGYTDSDYVAWHDWVTVYFLTPVPASIIYVLK